MEENSKKKENANENGSENDMSNSNPLYAATYYVTSARIEACKGKKYGDYCEWIDDRGIKQTGKCIYDKWGFRPGPLFCAKADYKSETEDNSDSDKEDK